MALDQGRETRPLLFLYLPLTAPLPLTPLVGLEQPTLGTPDSSNSGPLKTHKGRKGGHLKEGSIVKGIS